MAVIVAVAAAALLFLHGPQRSDRDAPAARASFGGPFTLEGSDGRPFSSARLHGKPYAIYFGFTRCADVCPTTLQRLVKLRDEAGGPDKFNIVFVTIDPTRDGPAEVGQYAELFGSPIIGLTGSQKQIDQVKRQFGIFAQPSPHQMAGKEMEHTAAVLLFDAAGGFEGTISPGDSNADALEKAKMLAGLGTSTTLDV